MSARSQVPISTCDTERAGTRCNGEGPCQDARAQSPTGLRGPSRSLQSARVRKAQGPGRHVRQGLGTHSGFSLGLVKQWGPFSWPTLFSQAENLLGMTEAVTIRLGSPDMVHRGLSWGAFLGEAQATAELLGSGAATSLSKVLPSSECSHSKAHFRFPRC